MAARKYNYLKKVNHYVCLVAVLLSNTPFGNCQGWGEFPVLQICSVTSSINNNVIIADGDEDRREFSTEECLCRINRRISSLIQIVPNEFICTPQGSWKLEIYEDGCLEHTFTCNDPTGDYFIIYQSITSDIYLRLVKTDPAAQGTYYHFNIFATAAIPSTPALEIIQTQCGIGVDSVPIYDCDSGPDISNRTTTSTTSNTPSELKGDKEDDSFIDNPLYLGLIIGVGALILVIFIICCIVCCIRRRKSRYGEKDNESVYSYTRSIQGGSVGSVNKDATALKTMDKHREKQDRKRQKQAERDRKRQEKLKMEEAKKHVYDNHISPITYDNNAYVGGYDNTRGAGSLNGTQNSMPDFIPVPPPPPQANGHAPGSNMPEYAQSSKVAKQAKKKKEEKSKKKKKSKDEKREIAVMNGGSVPYGYYDKVVDSEFSFIEDDNYSGLSPY